MSFELPKLGYAENALEPHISARTMGLHYNTHHQTYITNLNKFIKDTALEGRTLEDIVKTTHGEADKQAIFNNAGQTWNHNFFWKCMKPGGGGHPSGDLARKIDSDFGSFEAFTEAFTQAAIGRFGSGWAWLVNDHGTLKCVNTLNGDTPIAHGQTPLLGLDVWEHAYYLDYQYKRPAYVTAFLEHLVDWDFVAANLNG